MDGKAVKNSYRVSAGETVELEVPEAVEPEIEAEPIPLDILYEDKDIILINKDRSSESTFLDWVCNFIDLLLRMDFVVEFVRDDFVDRE